jgi:hypothetical protein
MVPPNHEPYATLARLDAPPSWRRADMDVAAINALLYSFDIGCSSTRFDRLGTAPRPRRRQRSPFANTAVGPRHLQRPTRRTRNHRHSLSLGLQQRRVTSTVGLRCRRRSRAQRWRPSTRHRTRRPTNSRAAAGSVAPTRNFSRWMSPVGVKRLWCRSPGWCPRLVG